MTASEHLQRTVFSEHSPPRTEVDTREMVLTDVAVRKAYLGWFANVVVGQRTP